MVERSGMPAGAVRPDDVVDVADVLKLTEAEFQAQIVEFAQVRSWRHYHTHDSQRSADGFPDLVLVRFGRLIFAELKTATGRVNIHQWDWLTDLSVTTAETYLWRPDDWNEIVTLLSHEILADAVAELGSEPGFARTLQAMR